MMPGLFDEAGGVAGISRLGAAEYKVLSVPMTSLEQLGTVVFALDPADDRDLHPTTLYASTAFVMDSQIEFGTYALTVVPEPTLPALFLTMIIGMTYRRHFSRCRLF